MNILETMGDPQLFEPWFRGASWDNWRTVLRGAFALPMSESERVTFRSLAEREPPSAPVRELWVIAGRRCGKDSVASLIAAHVASFFEPTGKLRPGERAQVACLATSREQSTIVLRYLKSYFNSISFL